MTLRAIFWDTETTGIKPEKDRIIEIAAYDPVRNRSFEKFVNPGCPIPKEASAIHGITDEMVASADSFAKVGQEFIEFCDGEVMLVAHNNDAFDIHFLRQECNRYQLTLPTWKYFDTLKWARRYRNDLPRHSLQFLREVYEIPANNAHRALDDVIVLHQVYKYMVDDLIPEQVYQLLNKPKVIQHMPFGKYQGKLLKDVPTEYFEWLKNSGAFEKPENQELKEAVLQLSAAALTA